MAELLKRENDIVTLKFELAQGNRRPGSAGPNLRPGSTQVLCALQYLDGGRLQTRQAWAGDIGQLVRGDPTERRRGRGDDSLFALPPELAANAKQWLHANGRAGQPVWVHLVKPYGALRFVPWERLLGEALDVPILMLPDFIFPPPRELSPALDVAICGSAPLHCEDAYVREGIREAILAIPRGLQRPLRLHVFTDADIAAQLRGLHEAAMPGHAQLIFHDQDAAAPYVVEDVSSRVVDGGNTLRSPWLLWMRESLRDCSTDIVHFVCHGRLSRARGAMLFAQSPLARTDDYLAGPVGAVELQSFLTQAGAWSTVFSSPRDNGDEAGLRALADEIAQSRPGPMMMHVPAHGDGDELADGYRFLYSQEPQSPPRSRALFVYCQPYLLSDSRGAEPEYAVAEHAHNRSERFARNAMQHRSVMRVLETSFGAPASIEPGNKPAVVSATERLAEQVQVQYQQVVRDEVIPGEIAELELDAAMDTLDRLREAVVGIELRRQDGAAVGASPPSTGDAP